MSELMRLARAAANGAQSDRSAADASCRRAARDSTLLPRGGCASCLHFTTAAGKTPDGWCGRYGVTTWGSYESGCSGGFVPKDSAIRALASRRRKLIEMLRADKALRYVYDVAGASPVGSAAGPVGVMVGLRDPFGTIITGELTVAAERWDMAAFIAYWDAQRGSS